MYICTILQIGYTYQIYSRIRQIHRKKKIKKICINGVLMYNNHKNSKNNESKEKIIIKI